MATTNISNVTPSWSLDNTAINTSGITTGIYNQEVASSNLSRNYSWVSCFDQKIASIKKNNTFVRAYNVAGIKIKLEEKFENSTQKMCLHFYGNGNVLDKEINFDETINVDTDIYNRYDWSVKNGILYVTLFEKINPRPDFKRVEKETVKAKDSEEK